MSNRVTKAMAEEAAKQLAAKAYGEKIKKAEQHRREVGLALYEQYIPKAVRDAADEHLEVYEGSYFLKFQVEDASAYDYIRVYYSEGETPRYFPNFKNIVLSQKDWKLLRGAEDEVKELEHDKFEYKRDAEQALVNLRTEKNVREQFPEALSYMNFTTCTALVPNINNLRTKLL